MSSSYVSVQKNHTVHKRSANPYAILYDGDPYVSWPDGDPDLKIGCAGMKANLDFTPSLEAVGLDRA